MKLNLPPWGTGIPVYDKRAHARGREQSYLSSRTQKLPVFKARIQAIASIFYPIGGIALCYFTNIKINFNNSDLSPNIFKEYQFYLFYMQKANRKIVEFIRDKWVIPADNNNLFAKNHSIDEKTVRRIREDDSYQIALVTIMRICEGENLKLHEFFKMVGV